MSAAALYRMTKPCCVECPSTHPTRCCTGEYDCSYTIENAKRLGVTLPLTKHPKVPLMGPHGCTAPPILRHAPLHWRLAGPTFARSLVSLSPRLAALDDSLNAASAVNLEDLGLR
jgi:hypothetical protein